MAPVIPVYQISDRTHRHTLPPHTHGTRRDFMPNTAQPAHAARRAARIPRRQSLAPSEELESLLPRLSMDQLLILAPQRAAPPQALRFPVQYHAVGECLAHPRRPCRCTKTRSMGQSSAVAWKELGHRYKASRLTTRDTPAPADRSRPTRPNSWPKSTTAARDRNAVTDPPALARLSSTPQEICPTVLHVSGDLSRTPGAAFRPNAAQAAAGRQYCLLRMREQDCARAHRPRTGAQEICPVGSHAAPVRRTASAGTPVCPFHPSSVQDLLGGQFLLRMRELEH
ncbi:hypothetical protein T484DRAFT_1751435 [Baffinella frigidus]|nr:hypothetical protein T484DRAFT_1751435 [Cryptophyta sp. CCMP2293]